AAPDVMSPNFRPAGNLTFLTRPPSTASEPSKSSVVSALSNAYSFKNLLESVDSIGLDKNETNSFYANAPGSDQLLSTTISQHDADATNTKSSHDQQRSLPLQPLVTAAQPSRKPSKRVVKVNLKDSEGGFGLPRSKSLDHRGLIADNAANDSTLSISNAKVNYAPLNDNANTKHGKVTMAKLMMTTDSKDSMKQQDLGSQTASRSVFASLGSLANLTSSAWSLNGSNKSLNSDLVTNDQKRKALDAILAKFFTDGSESEINVPIGMYERLAVRIRENNEYQPNVLKETMEEVYLMMKNSSYPKFVKHIEIHAAAGSGSHIVEIGIGSAVPLHQ
ncbi:hypothetical protein BDR26DRAFT_859888, partial [Obelidium mucronatum]